MRVLGRAFIGVARRPSLWLTAIVQAWRMFPPRADYVRFRMHTMYGADPAAIRDADVGNDLCLYLDWCRRVNALERLERRRFRNSLLTRLSQR